MGIIQKQAMPLLITLAALVLIVHTAEEDLETEYRHDLRPRILDMRTPNYDESWRAIETESVIQSTQNDELNNKSEEKLPKRRRPGRKRNRRPQPSSSEDIEPRERYSYRDEPPRPYFDITSHSARLATEPPIRRRKKPDTRPIHWVDDPDDYDRPLRRKSQRRKRPMLEPWPELSEFNGFRPKDTSHERIEVSAPAKHVINKDHDDNEYHRLVEFNDDHRLKEKQVVEQEYIEKEPRKSYAGIIRDGNHEYQKDIIKEDESLSEFSAEIMGSGPMKPLTDNYEENGNIVEKYTEKPSEILTEYEKVQENGVTNPLTLKDILKRSNGTSLSEILQKHNLSLADLLHGKPNAVSIFNAGTFVETKSSDNNPNQMIESLKAEPNLLERKQSLKSEETNKNREEKELLNSVTDYTKITTTTTTKNYLTTTEEIEEIKDEAPKKDQVDFTTTKDSLVKHDENNEPKIVNKRRYPIGIRKKLRIRPILNDTYKAQLSRDLVTLNSRKYSHHRRNITKFKQWHDVIPALNQNNTSSENTIILEQDDTTTIVNLPEVETTTYIGIRTDEIDLKANQENKLEDVNIDEVQSTTDFLTTKIIEVKNEITEQPAVVPMPRPTAISSGLRQQALNNRLKRKRLKYKKTTTEPPQDDLIKHLFGMGNLVSSSEFITRTHEPMKNMEENSREYTTLQDFITTERTNTHEIRLTNTKSLLKTSTTPLPIIYTTTEETANIEIEEILNDTKTSAKLSKILMERNMTLSELVEHRERGSSHVHLADIFHNASREPNPPEPFLSKSFIEPISKETYPLRALLEANLHDTTAKPMTEDASIIQISNINIPVVMDFRNNVNENAENMGIMSLFNNFTKNLNTTAPIKDSQDRLYERSVSPVNTNNTKNPNNVIRESRILSENIDDVVSWNEIFELMRKNQKHETEGIDQIEETTQEPFQKIGLHEDIDGDGLIVLEDLEHLKDFERKTGSGEKLLVKTYEKVDAATLEPSVFEKLPSQTRSITVATASVAGLAMILFLLTYTVFKWREQRSNNHKKNSFYNEQIPTPVFEKRKSHRNNSSMRSISPMLQSSNIYTLNTLDSKTGKDSPEYMWDTLRKPFQ